MYNNPFKYHDPSGHTPNYGGKDADDADDNGYADGSHGFGGPGEADSRDTHYERSNYVKRMATRRLKNGDQRRTHGIVYVTGRKILGFLPVHTALELTYPDGSYKTWSATQEKGLLVSKIGSNKDKDNRDAPENNFTIGIVDPPNGLTVGEYENRLDNIDGTYKDNTHYDLFPESDISPYNSYPNSHNSNSYVSGLIEATGGSTSIDLDDYFGAPNPLSF